jgi:DNA-binding MarR family transcriptional regulator
VARRSLSAKRTTRSNPSRPGPTRTRDSITTTSHLDRVIHEPVRLGIVSALAVNPSLSFRDLKDLLSATDGNLSVHARKLEEASYISCSKQFEGRTPKTKFKITAAGRRALENYLDHMDALIKATRNG